jgi:hypothetical protein
MYDCHSEREQQVMSKHTATCGDTVYIMEKALLNKLQTNKQTQTQILWGICAPYDRLLDPSTSTILF